MGLVQLSLYPGHIDAPPDYPISVNDQLLEMLNHGSPVAIGVSGGKDSSAVAARTATFLKEIAHAGPVILIHSENQSWTVTATVINAKIATPAHI
jgi:NH3-dependent NAD+ synthetase